MLLYKNRKNSWLTTFGKFDAMQKHCELPMKNNITSKYLWKHSILYPLPMIFDIKQKMHPVIPMEKIRAPKKTTCDGPNLTSTSTDEKKWSVIKRHQQWKEKNEKWQFYHSETLFFSPIQWSWLTSSRGTSSPCRIYIYIYVLIYIYVYIHNM